MSFIPHTNHDTEEMLAVIGAQEISELFDEIPPELLYKSFKNIPQDKNEQELLRYAKDLANKNQIKSCFIGAGAYEHHIPAAVWDLASRGEFYTAYTPYQAEASQGTLQLLYEFQTMIAEITGMQVANASLYDGATALAEAILMAARLKKDLTQHKVIVCGSLHPHYLETVNSIVSEQNIILEIIPFDTTLGKVKIEDLPSKNNIFSALVIQQPNFFGCLEDVDELTDWAHNNNILVIGCVNPISLGLIKPPGHWGTKNLGADIVCGEGQPLGSPLAGGGPYFGFFSTKLEYVRQMPGRLIGKTVDNHGREGYALTLQAREQHIRRGKATSNICTNQGLLVTAATIHMSLIGPSGLYNIAKQCHIQTQYLIHLMTKIPGIKLAFTSPYFHECVLQFDRPLEPIIEKINKQDILPGLLLEPYFPKLENSLLVCVTETKTNADLEAYAGHMANLMSVTNEVNTNEYI